MSSFAALREAERRAEADRQRLGEYRDGVRQYLCESCCDTGVPIRRAPGGLEITRRPVFKNEYCIDCPTCDHDCRHCHDAIRHSMGLHLRDPHSNRRWCRLDCFEESLAPMKRLSRIGLTAAVLGEYSARFEEETDANSTREDTQYGLCEILNRCL